jgi:streptomycin 6-kinase
VDPILLRGDPEYDFARAMWTRLDEMPDVGTMRRSLAELATAADIPLEAVRTWAALRCVDYWLWGLEHGLTEDPKRCARLITAL